MRYIFLILLIPQIGFCNEVNLHLIQTLTNDGFETLDQWYDPVPFVYLGVELNIEAKVIIVWDQNRKDGVCGNSDSQLIYFKTDKTIQPKRLMFKVNLPCVANPFDEARLVLEVITLDKKHYYKKLKFISTYKNQRN